MIYNPVNDELFTAERGKGAFLNDRRIRVAGRKRLAEAVIAWRCPIPVGAMRCLRATSTRPCKKRSPVCDDLVPLRSILRGSPRAGSMPTGSAGSRSLGHGRRDCAGA